MEFHKQHYPDMGKGIISLCVIAVENATSDTDLMAREVSREFPELNTGIFCDVNVNAAGQPVLTFSMYTCMVPESYELCEGSADSLMTPAAVIVPAVEMPPEIKTQLAERQGA